MDEHEVAAQLASAARAMDEAADEPVTAQTMVEHALGLVPAAEGISLTVPGRRGRFLVLSSTSDTARELDEQQHTLAEGPSLWAATSDPWVRAGDLATDPRWPAWSPRAVVRGVRSVLSVQLSARGEAIGSLSFYAPDSGVLDDDDDLEVARLYATHAAIALTATRDVARLGTALQSRHTIGVAQGILIERYAISVERSFELLRRHSNDLNIPLASVAEELVRTRDLPTR